MSWFFSRALHQFFAFSGTCRFEPTCSQYCAEAVEAQGLKRGLISSVKRILKCHPLGSSGFDPVDRSGVIGGRSGF